MMLNSCLKKKKNRFPRSTPGEVLNGDLHTPTSLSIANLILVLVYVAIRHRRWLRRALIASFVLHFVFDRNSRTARKTPTRCVCVVCVCVLSLIHI